MALLVSVTAIAQEDSTRARGFKKENLFTGGGITLSFGSNGTVLGLSPVFGYSIAKWIDAGLGVNFVYSSNRHVTYYYPSTGQYFVSNDKLKQTTIGPAAFVRLYPVRFLFAHAQGEINFINQKFIYADGYPAEKVSTSAPSFLVGGGYCNGREGTGSLFYYVSILFDIAKDKNSPYVEQVSDGDVNVLPIIRAGIQVPLFQGRSLL